MTSASRPSEPARRAPALRLIEGGATQQVGSFAEALRRRWHGAYVVDEWGFDGELLDAVTHLTWLRWQVSVGGDANIPPFGPALLVSNRRLLGATPVLVAMGVRRATGRAVRFAGVPDVAPVGPVLRRIGGVLARPDELSGLLRAGHLVLVPGEVTARQPDRAGAVPVPLVATALEVGVPVLPVAVLSRPLGRHARVEIGPPVSHRAVRGPLAEVELAEAARAGVQRLLDENDRPGWLLGG